MGDGNQVTIGGLLRASRIRAGMSARRLSALAGLSPSYVGKVESGDIEPSLRAFARIARVLNMSQREVVFLVGLAASEVGGDVEVSA